MLENFLKDESGASAAEYSLLVGLIALVIFSAVSDLGNILRTIFSNGANIVAAWPTS